MNNILDTLKADEHSRNAQYSNGKADLCGDLLEQFKDMPDEIRSTLYAIQHTERSRAIEELKASLAILNNTKEVTV